MQLWPLFAGSEPSKGSSERSKKGHPAPSKSDPDVESKLKTRLTLASNYLHNVYSQHPTETLLLSGFTLGAATIFVATRVRMRYRRFPTSNWITPDVLAKRPWVKGLVTSVGDADNFRLYHTPGVGWGLFRFVPSKSKDRQGQTLHIRMAGVDAPEAAHFGKLAQPFSGEALKWLKSRVEGKMVYCQLVARDHYSRIVAVPMLPRWFLPGFLTPRFGRCVSLEMLRDGWATTYKEAGAEYGRWGKGYFLAQEAQAKDARRGQWASGAQIESPAEYKRRHRQLTKKSGSERDLEKAVKRRVPKKRRWRDWLTC